MGEKNVSFLIKTVVFPAVRKTFSHSPGGFSLEIIFILGKNQSYTFKKKKSSSSNMSLELSVRPEVVEGWGSGPAIDDSIRSSSNNDNRNNADRPTQLTAWAEGVRGERQAQFLETDWENITFLELFNPSPLSLHPPLFIYCCLLRSHTHMHARSPTGHPYPPCIYTDETHQPPFGLDERSVLSIHLVVQAAGVTQVVSGAVAPPQRCGRGSTVYTLTALWWRRIRRYRWDISYTSTRSVTCSEATCVTTFCAVR